jgi:hypothetical protein
MAFDRAWLPKPDEIDRMMAERIEDIELVA